ncbi:hypothetical protein ACPWT1_13175 [Ramlibacter sp. MMS24-I3-19]|uniref:hypothetical protein n=1 Tax=Ramlibacter sp. MMS24-I3-19 TaxID=3416606 RepID=UPI003CFCF9F4
MQAVMQEQQQQQQAQVAPIEPKDEAPAQAPRRAGDDDTWGLGSATALESLRRRNFRGRRPSSSEERPSSE